MTENELESPQGCTPEALVEKVAQALAKEARLFWPDFTNGEQEVLRGEARAAIAVLRPVIRAEALEEAAKAVAAMPRTYDKVREDADVLGIKGTWTFTLNNGPAECAAAIRALKEKQ